MKILIIGGSSFIGTNMTRSFSKNNDVKYSYFTNKPEIQNGFKLDIRNKEETKEFLKEHSSDIVIISTALTNVDLCETSSNLANSINVQGTQNIVDACKEFQNKIVFISTSAVFDGRKSLYDEEDKPNPTSVYGSTKFEAEEIVRESGNPYLILRTDQPYGWKENWHHTNSVLRVIENLKYGKSFKEITNWHNSPTYVPDFIHTVEKLLKGNYEGIFHLVGSDFINRFQWALTVANVFNFKKELIEKIDSSELDLSVKRTNVHLSNKKVEEKINHKMIGVEEGAKMMFKEYQNFN